MPGMRLQMVVLAALAGLMAADARAAYITIEPDDFAAGTEVSNANSLVSLSTFRNYFDTSYVPSFSGVFAADCYAGVECATTGTKVFRDGFGGDDRWGALGNSHAIGSGVQCFQSLMTTSSPGCGDERFNLMLMSLAAPADSVEISGAFWADDDTYLYGFDESFNLVGEMSRNVDYDRCRGPNAFSDWCHTNVSLTSEAGDIRYVLAGGWSNGTSLDNLRVGVPEPDTLVLLALGLAGMRLCRRKAATPRDAREPGIPCSASR